MTTKQIRDVLELEPAVGRTVGEWLRRCNARGVLVLIYETFRSRERQLELYRVGRMQRADGEWIRLPGERIVTRARPGYSFHQYRRALDAVPFELHVEGGDVRRRLDWTPFAAGAPRDRRERLLAGELEVLDPRWRTMVEEADAVGLEWAGRWRSVVEYVHFQATNGLSIDELRNQWTRGETPDTNDERLG